MIRRAMDGSLWTQKIQQFFAGRAPRSDQIRLGIKNVYIFFSRQGLLFGVLLLVTFVMGVNYGNNLVLGLCFYLFAIWLVGIFYTFVQISSLRLHFVEATLTQAHSVAWVTLEISSRSAKPSRQIYLTFDQSDESLPPVGVASLDKPTLVHLPVQTDKRGYISLPRLTISSTYPLGIMKAWAYVYLKSGIYVYPKPRNFDYQTFNHATLDANETLHMFGVVGQNDFDKLDAYQQGESLARVSWGHLARGAGMLSKHFADSVGHERCLDYAKMPSSNHEHKLAELVFAIQQLHALHVPFVLILPSGQSELGVGEAFVQECLRQIAKEPSVR